MSKHTHDREPFITFRWMRNVSWFRIYLHPAGRLVIWARWFSASVGKRWPKDDGWPS